MNSKENLPSGYWETLENIFYNVLSCPVEERQNYIKKTCAHNAKLYKDIKSLLNSYEKAQGEGFLAFSLNKKYLG